MTNAAYWKTTEVVLEQNGRLVERAEARTVAETLKNLVVRNTREVVFCLSAYQNEQKGCCVSVTVWCPNTCQGTCWNTFCLCYVPSCTELVWTRQPRDHFVYLPDGPHPLKTPMGVAKAFSALYDIVWSISPSLPSQLEIESLGNDLASAILAWKLSADATRLEFCDSSGNTARKRRVLGLCCGILRNPASKLRELYCDDFSSFGDNATPSWHQQLFFEAIAGSTQLESLDLRNGRRIHSWSSEHPIRRTTGEQEIPLSVIELLVSAMSENPHGRFRKLDLSGHIVSGSAAMALAEAIPNLGLDSLLLRDCNLKDDVLMRVALSLRKDRTLRKLDLSHSPIGSEVLAGLCLSLQHNTTLETLILEHCGLGLDQARCIAGHLAGMKGLRCLSLDGNEFTYAPLEKERFSIGATLLVESLENNRSLHSLQLGEYGQIFPVSRVCCTSASYTPALSGDSCEKMNGWLQRNKRHYDARMKSRMHEGIVKIVGLLLRK